MEASASFYSKMLFPGPAEATEPELAELQKAMLDATPDCIKVVSTEGILLLMNRAGCAALGVAAESGFGMPWLPLLPEDVHAAGGVALSEAAGGKPARFPGRSESPEGIIHWDNLLTPIFGRSGKVRAILCVSRDITEKTILDRKLQEAIERESLLAREMHHRIKNLFSVVSALISLSEREANAAVEPPSAADILREKLAALARASDAAFAHDAGNGDDAAVDLDVVVRSVLGPYGARCRVSGQATPIPRERMTSFALFLHELATNALKYGALGAEQGEVVVAWMLDDDRLRLTWTESGGPEISAPPKRTGFGTLMVERIVRASGGTIEKSWQRSGLRADLSLPVSP